MGDLRLKIEEGNWAAEIGFPHPPTPIYYLPSLPVVISRKIRYNQREERTRDTMAILKIYTDGACSGNQNTENIGGWGAILEYGSHRKELYGGERNTTNNRMEMMALLRAFEAIKKEGQTIWAFSDSSYLMNCFREKWYEKWRKNGWKNAGKKDVENQDLWKALLPYLDRHDIRFFRVKGHVDPDSPKTDMDMLYKKFIEWNGDGFSPEDFLHVTRMNNRADELAGLWKKEQDLME